MVVRGYKLLVRVVYGYQHRVLLSRVLSMFEAPLYGANAIGCGIVSDGFVATLGYYF